MAGCSPYERLTPEAAARVLLDPRGSRKGCPEGARFVVFVNRETIPTDYTRFLERCFRENLPLEGSPVRLRYRRRPSHGPDRV